MTPARFDHALCRRLAEQLSATSKRLALLDVDGTLTTEKSAWQFIMTRIGCWEPDGRANLERFLSGEIDYEEFCRLDGALFAEVQYSRLVEIASLIPWQPGIDDFFTALQAADFTIAIISSGLRVLVRRLSERYPIATATANDLEVAAGLCTGNVHIEVRDGHKGIVAQRVIDSFQPDFILAVGDSHGDLPLFELADFSVAVSCSDEQVRNMATLSVPDGDLSAIGKMLTEADRLSCIPAGRRGDPGRVSEEAR